MSMQIPLEVHGRAILSAVDTVVLMKGEIEQNEPHRFLDPFFREVIAQMGAEITLDIRELEFINSAAISCLIEFIIHRKKGSRLHIKINRTRGWQKFSVDVLQSLDRELILLEEA